MFHANMLRRCIERDEDNSKTSEGCAAALSMAGISVSEPSDEEEIGVIDDDI